MDYYTQAVSEEQIKINEKTEEKVLLDNKVGLGGVSVTSLTYMFKKIKFYNRESIGYENLNLPPQQFDTTSVWIVPPKSAFILLKHYGRSTIEGLMGIANVIIEVIPVFTMGDQTDIGTTIDSSNLGIPSLFVFDRFPGGMGFSERVYEKLKSILEGALSVIEKCPCRIGCPSCVGSAVAPFAMNELDDATKGKIPDKEAALILLHEMLKLKKYVPKYNAPSLDYAQDDIHVEPKIKSKKLPPQVERNIRKRLRDLS